MVTHHMDIRRFPRVKVEEGFSIRFQAGNRRFFGLPVTSLGGGGCCIRVSALLAEGLRQDAMLSRVGIEHPEIPETQQQARVSWVLGNHPGHEEPTVLVGIEYLDPDLDFVEAIDRCIAKLHGND